MSPARGWLDSEILARHRRALIEATAELEKLQHTDNIVVTRAVQRAIAALRDDLIPVMSRVLEFDGWSRWDSQSVAPLPSRGPNFVRSPSFEDIATRIRRLAAGHDEPSDLNTLLRFIARVPHRLPSLLGGIEDPRSLINQTLNTLSARTTSASTIAFAHGALNALGIHAPDALRRIIDSARRSPHHASALLRVIPRLTATEMTTWAQHLMNPVADATIGIDPIADYNLTTAFVTRLLEQPEALPQVLATPQLIDRLAHEPLLPTDLAESLYIDATQHLGGATMLAALVAAHASSDAMNDSALHGAAVALASCLDELGATIDLHYVIANSARGAVPIGNYGDLSALLGSVMQHPTSRVILGTALASMLVTKVDRAVELLGDDDDRDPAATFASQLGGIDATRTVISQAIEDNHDRRSVQSAERFSKADLALGLSSTLLALTLPGARVASSLLSTSRTVLDVVDFVHDIDEPVAIDTRIAEVDMNASVEVLSRIAGSPTLQDRIGATDVGPATWRSIATTIEQFGAATNDEVRHDRYAELIRLCSDSPDLLTFINEFQALRHR